MAFIQTLTNLLSDGAQTAQMALKNGTKVAGRAANWSCAHSCLAVAVAGAGAAVLVAPSLVSAPALCAVGFCAAGVQASSIAASVQSIIGNVVAGSPFAILQSAGAGGAGLAFVNYFTQAAAVMVGGSAAFLWRRFNSTRQE